MKELKQIGLSKRKARKVKKFLVAASAFAAIALAPGPAHAEAISTAIAVFVYEAGASAATAYAIGQAVVSFAITSALSYAVAAITKPSTGGYSTNSLSNRTHMVRSSVAARNIVYGRCMVSGPLAFIATTNKNDGANGVTGSLVKGGENAYLHLVVMLANHEIDAVEEIYLGDEPIGMSTLAGNKPVGGRFGGIIEQGDAVTTTYTLAANATTLTIPNFGASMIVGLAEVGLSPASTTGGGEYGVDVSSGNIVLPNGGTAATDLPFTFVNATTVTTPAVNRSRTVALTYASKGQARSYVDVYTHLGSPSQSADAALMASCPGLWTAAHRLQGIAYLYLRMEYSPTIFPNGIPNVKALVRGKKVNDPRNGAYPADTPTWTANYALCAMDYLKSSDGLGCADADLDLEQIKVAANICDEVVTIRPQTGSQGTVTLAMYQKRYEVNGSMLLDHDVEENLRSLSTAGGGPVPLLVSGRFQVPVGYYGTPVAQALTESDLRSTVKVRPRTSRRDLFNAVGGTYIDGRINWQPTDFPEVSNSLYRSQDAGEKIRRDITLPFTTDEMMAQRLAKIMLERSRQAITIDWPGKPSCFRLSVGDLVPVSLAKFGWTNKVFRVIAWSMDSSGTIDLVLQEDASGIYDWNYGTATTTDLSKDTNLPDPAYIAPMGALTCYSDSSELVRTGDGTIISRLHVLWPASTDAGVVNGGEFQVQYKKAADTFWTPWDKISGAFSETWITPVVDSETYYVRVRAVNARDIATDWVYAKHTIIGNTGAPPNVTGFGLTVRADGTRDFHWDTSNQPINVTTGGGYRLKYRIWTSNAAWSAWLPLHNGLLSQSPLQIADPIAGTYDFGIVAVNASRIESNTPATINDARIGREPVSYDAAVNLIPNSDWQMSNGLDSGESSGYGWKVQWSDGTSYAGAGRPAGVGRNKAPWNPGRGGFYIFHSTTALNPNGLGQPRDESVNVSISNVDVPGMRNLAKVTAGGQYEISVLVNPHGCRVALNVEWYRSATDASGNRLLSTVRTGDVVDNAQASDTGSGSLTGEAGLGGWQAGYAGMIQMWGVVTAPSDAAFAKVYLVKKGTYPDVGNVNQESYAFWNRVMMCAARPGVTRQTATPWIESSYDQLHGGSLTNLSVNSAQIAAEAATTFRVATSGYGIRYNYPGNTNYGTEAVAIGYTAVVDCLVSVVATYSYYLKQSPSNGNIFFSGNPKIGLSSTIDTGANQFDGTRDGQRELLPAYSGADTTSLDSAIITRTYPMSAGQYAEFRAFGGGNVDNVVDFFTVYTQIRLEVIKK